MATKIRNADRLSILAEAKKGATSAALALCYPYPQTRISRLIAEGVTALGRKLSAEDEDAMLAEFLAGGTTGAALARRYGVHRNSVHRALNRAMARANGDVKQPRKAPALTPEQAAEADRLQAAGEPVAALAQRYVVGVAAVTQGLARHRRDVALHATIDGRPVRPQTETGHTGLTGDLAAKVLAKREAMRLENPTRMNVIPELAQMFNLPAGVIKQTLIDARKRQLAQPDFSHLA